MDGLQKVRVAAIVMIVGGGATGLYRMLGPRTVRVRAAVSESFKTRPDWRKLLEDRLAAVSEIHRTAGGPRWKLSEVVDWNCNVGIEGLDVCRNKLRESPGVGGADVVIGLVSQDNPPRTASAVPFSPAAVIIDQANQPEDRNRLVMAHELAHLFGCTHPPQGDPPSLMSATPANATFDAKNAAVLKAEAKFNFAKGITGLDAASLDKLADTLGASVNGPGVPRSRGYQLLGLSLRAEGRSAQALQMLEKAMQAGSYPGLRFDIAAAYAEDHQANKAVEQLEKLVAEQPEFPGARAALASMMAQAGRGDEAIAMLQADLEKNPQNALLHMLLGTALMTQMGKFDQGIAELEKAAQLAPNSPEAQRNLARAKAAREQLSDATRQRLEAAKQKPNDAPTVFGLGVAQAREGKFADAIASFRRASQLNPKMGEAHANLAAIYYQQKNYKESAQELEAAKQLGAKINPKLSAELAKHLGN